MRDGAEVPVKESVERWTEVTLEDGTVLRLKITVFGAVRVDGEYDPEGNPAYQLKMTPVISTVSCDPKYRRPAPAAGIH